jgi:5-methylcytosine-specific restriction endonuclease McrA
VADPSLRWPAGLRQFILERDHRQCQIRGPHCSRGGTEIDHVVPREDGGAWFEPSNLRAACRPCNAGRRLPTIPKPDDYPPAPAGL